jgi:hypothetical protein
VISHPQVFRVYGFGNKSLFAALDAAKAIFTEIVNGIGELG